MPHRPLPEAIRGCWFFIPDASPQTQSGQKASSIIHFNLDGSFERFQTQDTTRKTIEQGTYTFDGMFLILRGRTTDTYRVRLDSFYHWNLEGKKEGQALVRGYPSHVSSTDLTLVDPKEIHHLPIHISVGDEYTRPLLPSEHTGSSNGIYQLFYHPHAQNNEIIANFFVEFHPENRLWIGLSPFVKGIDPPTWQRIINDCFLNIYLNKPTNIDSVTLLLLDSNNVQTFHYKTA